MSRTDKQPAPITLSPSNQMAEGVHATMNDLKEGDTIVPAEKRLGSVNSSKSDASKTYFAPAGPGEKLSWDFIENAKQEQEYLGRQPNRPRLLRTAPSQDQQLDRNYIRSGLKQQLNVAKMNGSSTPIRDAINAVKATGPRTSSSQTVTGVEWAPRPTRPGEFVESTLPHINWNQFGGENYKVWDQGGGYYTDRGEYVNEDLARVKAREAAPQEDTGPPQPSSVKNIPGQLTIEDAGVAIPKDPHDTFFG